MSKSPVKLLKDTIITEAQQTAYDDFVASLHKAKQEERRRLYDREFQFEQQELERKMHQGRGTSDDPGVFAQLKGMNKKLREQSISGWTTGQSIFGELLLRSRLWKQVVSYSLFKHFKIMGVTLPQLKHELKKQVKNLMNDVGNRFSDPEIVVPTLTHFVEVDDKGHLQTDSISFLSAGRNKEESDFIKRMNSLLNEDVKRWLDSRGYEVNQKREIRKKNAPTQAAMTKNEFIQLRDGLDGKQSLADFIHQRWKLDVQQRENKSPDSFNPTPTFSPQ